MQQVDVYAIGASDVTPAVPFLTGAMSTQPIPLEHGQLRDMQQGELLQVLGQRDAVDAAGHPRYRPDIDGLRALAVTSVVLYHAGVESMSGGFVGVDVFFVISGYLIGAIVFAEVSSGTFSFARFYARRARRILPALLFLTAVLWCVALVMFTPGELDSFAWSSGASTLGVSNILFWKSVTYFAPDAHLDPFLMTWSLGVEEQFYVLLPALLLLIHRYLPRHMFAIVAAGSIASLILSILLTARTPSAAFYLLPTRAWELGAGVALAIARYGRAPVQSRWATEALAVTGLAAIGAAVIGFNETTAFPGIAAMLPTMGCVALLMSERSTINRRILSAAPFRGVGLVSYSWYLWHWPLLALLRIGHATPPPQSLKLAAVGLSLFLAILSWRYVERPFRRGSATSARALSLAGATMATFVTLSVLIGVTGGPALPIAGATAATPQTIADQVGGTCLAPYGVATPRRSAACGDGVDNVEMALLGDSHAAAFAAPLKAAGAERGVGTLIRTKTSCPFLIGVARPIATLSRHASDCLAYNDHVLEEIVGNTEIKLVFLAGHWSAISGAGSLVHGASRGRGPSSDALPHYLTKTIRVLRKHAKRVVVLGSTPEFRFNPLTQSLVGQIPARRTMQTAINPAFANAGGRVGFAYVDRYPELNARIAQSAYRSGAAFADVGKVFCSSSACSFASDSGKLLYLDPQHLSRHGADTALADAGVKQSIASLAGNGR